ncbi:MAG: class II fructose-bisphosphate aldolase [Devosia sp.]|nr:class II fructose-bisphosphate aldolase [Devosia sp.]
MAGITLRQLLERSAAERGYGVPALISTTTWSRLSAILEAAREVDAPVILQASRGPAPTPATSCSAASSMPSRRSVLEIPLCMHQDHGNNVATRPSAYPAPATPR